jgi:hypothetical protein
LHYQEFKRAVIARFPREGFRITAEAIEEWARATEEQEQHDATE